MEYTINITRVVPHIKYQIAEEKVNELLKFLTVQVSNEKVETGTSVFKSEVNTFKQSIKDALEVLKLTTLLDSFETFSDEQITLMMLKLEELKVQRDSLLADPDVSDIDNSYRFKEIKSEIVRLKDIKDKLEIAGWVST